MTLKLLSILLLVAMAWPKLTLAQAVADCEDIAAGLVGSTGNVDPMKGECVLSLLKITDMCYGTKFFNYRSAFRFDSYT